jgi:hypothetical protein
MIRRNKRFTFFIILGAASLIDELQTQIRRGTLFKNKSGSSSSKASNTGLSASEMPKSETMNSIVIIEKTIDHRFSSQVEINASADVPEWKKQLLERKKIRHNE